MPLSTVLPTNPQLAIMMAKIVWNKVTILVMKNKKNTKKKVNYILNNFITFHKYCIQQT